MQTDNNFGKAQMSVSSFVRSKFLAVSASTVAGLAALTLSIGVNPSSIAESGKQSTLASLPSLSITAGEQAKAEWIDIRSDAQRRENLRKAMQKWAGFCSSNIHDEKDAANRNLEKAGQRWRYAVNRNGMLYTYGP